MKTFAVTRSTTWSTLTRTTVSLRVEVVSNGSTCAKLLTISAIKVWLVNRSWLIHSSPGYLLTAARQNIS